jgi:carotenoid cleavage dioxygenase-like enzyme
MPTAWPRAAFSRSRADRDDVALRVLAGALPADLHGHLWLIGPAGLHDHAPPSDRPLYVGDGRLWRVDLATVRAHARLVRGDDGAVDEAATGPTRRFYDLGLARVSPAWGARAFHHTAVLPLRRRGGRALLVTSDAARPLQVDPVTLMVRGAWGDDWRAAALPRHRFPLVLTTAHPVHDPATDELFSVNYGPGFLDVLRWDSTLTRTPLVDPAGRPVRVRHTLHQLALTARHVVLADTSFEVGPAQLGLGRLARCPGPIGAVARGLARAPAPSGRVWWVRRDALGRGQPATAVGVDVPGGVAHLLADDDDDPLVLHLVHGRGLDLAAWLHRGDRLAHRPDQPVPADLHGMVAGPSDVGVFGRLTLDPATGRVLDHAQRWDADLTWCPGLYAGVGVGHEDAAVPRHRDLWWFTVGVTPDLAAAFVDARPPADRHVPADQLHDLLRAGGLPSRVLRMDTDTLTIADVHDLPADVTLGAPQLLPSRDGGPGWLSVVVWTPTRAELWLYAPRDLARGPVCRLAAPDFDPGFLMHPAWTPALT